MIVSNIVEEHMDENIDIAAKDILSFINTNVQDHNAQLQFDITSLPQKKEEEPIVAQMGTHSSYSQKDSKKHIRRIIAEDSTYNLSNVATLTQLTLKHIIDNFAFNCRPLGYLTADKRAYVLNQLSTEIPLKVTANLISESGYWQRCCRKRWPYADFSRHHGDWKRAFFELHLQEMIENFVPDETYGAWLQEALQYASPYVRCLTIRQLLPPKKNSKNSIKSVDASDGDSDSEEQPTISADHLELGVVIQKLKLLEHLFVQYQVNECGMNFEWSLFQFTGLDCISLSRAIKSHTNLSVLELTRSRVDCERCRVLVSYIMDHPTLRVLNLSSNVISDWGSRAVAKMLHGHTKLLCLDLSSNKITERGGLAIGNALAKNASDLICLNLRLNQLKDEGSCAIAKSLLKNDVLEELNLSANDISDPAILSFSQILTNNLTLRKLDLSNNKISTNAGRRLQESISSNNVLNHLDLRFTGCPQESEFAIQMCVEANEDRFRATAKTCVSRFPGLTTVAYRAAKDFYQRPNGQSSLKNRRAVAEEL